MADLRADRDLDRLSRVLRLGGLDAVGGAVHRRARHHPARRQLRAALRRRRVKGAADDRWHVRGRVAGDAVRARRGRGRHRGRTRPGRQRRGESHHQLAEPDLDPDRPVGGGVLRLPGRRVPRRRRRRARGDRPGGGVPGPGTGRRRRGRRPGAGRADRRPRRRPPALHGSRPRRRARGPDPVGRRGHDDDGAQHGAPVRACALHGRARRGARRRRLGDRAVADAPPRTHDRPGRRPARHDGGSRRRRPGGGRPAVPRSGTPVHPHPARPPRRARRDDRGGGDPRVRAASRSCSWDRRSEPAWPWRC